MKYELLATELESLHLFLMKLKFLKENYIHQSKVTLHLHILSTHTFLFMIRNLIKIYLIKLNACKVLKSVCSRNL